MTAEKYAVPLLGSVDKLIGLASEFITDKDRMIEFQYKAQALKVQSALELAKIQTVPWVDAVVKLVLSLTPIWRPLGLGAMTAFGMYAHAKGIVIPTEMHYIFDAAFPGWGVSRHMQKAKEIEKAPAKAEPDPTLWQRIRGPRR